MKNKVVSWQNLSFVVLIIIILMLSLNFGNITGKMTAETDSGLSIGVPNVIKSRETMEIKITPGKDAKKGYYPGDIDIINENRIVVGSAKINGCSYYCKKEGKTNYVLPELDPGKYFIRVIDWDLGGYVEVPFIIVTPYN